MTGYVKQVLRNYVWCIKVKITSNTENNFGKEVGLKITRVGSRVRGRGREVRIREYRYIF